MNRLAALIRNARRRLHARLEAIRWCDQARYGNCACRGDGAWNGSVLDPPTDET